jgi:hypothetical protein
MKPQHRSTLGHLIQQPIVIGPPVPRKTAVTGHLKRPRKLPIRGRVVGQPVPRTGKATRAKEAQ